ncbi:XdhC family protein [Rhodophyticola porphyridii]|uniref:XdhC /CoxI family-like protein n=1 Tax=Rhodophyticola porphyridii TaxID=1852017 RepID=A0A3L9Y412_9RHOB|nr:XdhC/CoxI family protein [Rhodophyticola porphyridii]RMA40856.1 XdhC /CoxI family-like protein [Rhodophyticola porphyridii]
MTLSATEYARLEAKMQALKAAGVPFAMATVVRTVDATSAKPGGKALLDRQGTILMGWVGGGCARGAVGKAAREAIETGAPQLISLRPQELLETEGLTAGDMRDGVRFARNGCPSKGTMDVFVEPVLPLPDLVIFGTGLVAMALADLGGRLDFKVTLCGADGAEIDPALARHVPPGFEFAADGFVVVATQGQGDLAALRAAVTGDAAYVSFVGSRRKFASLVEKLQAEDASLAPHLARVHAPAGLDINAITPEEIALSVLAQITSLRRSRAVRGGDDA